jgi:VIT1/CCC1 family predicted Fe2+/Mn2+ transporter
LGCNVAWGIIDAVLFLLGIHVYRQNRSRIFNAITGASDDKTALAEMAQEFPLEDGPLALDPRDQDELYRYLLSLAKRAKPSATAISIDDLIGAVIVFLIVAATAIPAVIPFLLIDDKYLALRVSNLLLVGLLYAAGHSWARFAGSRPFAVGMAMTVLGLVLVTIALILGG